MKVNREQFLAAALLFASTASTGCGELSERMKGEFNASQDPAATPVAVTDTPGAPGTPTDPNSIGRVQGGKVKGGLAPPAAKNGTVSVNAKTPISGPANEGVGPASENVGPASENVGPSKEGWSQRNGPSNEAVALTNGKMAGPSNEGGGWRRRGPANETAAVGPSNEGGWRPRPGGPSSETPVKPKPAPTVKPVAAPKKA